jgi:hypothetical protein
MIEVRPFASLGHANHGWLDANFHFSFADYFNQRRMHWGALRVWNDDVIAPRNGFPAHSHADMEIITYVRAGAISHRDSLGNDGVTRAGDVQVMSAGTGITHSEFNQEDEPSHSFQLWIMPSRKGEAPRWDTRAFPKDDRAGNFVALASGDPADSEALRINADARVLAGQGGRDGGISAGRGAQGLSGGGRWLGRTRRPDCRHARRRGHRGRAGAQCQSARGQRVGAGRQRLKTAVMKCGAGLFAHRKARSNLGCYCLAAFERSASRLVTTKA